MRPLVCYPPIAEVLPLPHVTPPPPSLTCHSPHGGRQSTLDFTGFLYFFAAVCAMVQMHLEHMFQVTRNLMQLRLPLRQHMPCHPPLTGIKTRKGQSTLDVPTQQRMTWSLCNCPICESHHYLKFVVICVVRCGLRGTEAFPLGDNRHNSSRFWMTARLNKCLVLFKICKPTRQFPCLI